MNIDTDLAQTPLQNLFYYIRDLYNARQDCLDFTQEPGNPKTPGVHYWELGQWMSLARQCAQKHLPEFDLGMTGQGQDYLLTIRRITLPAPPEEPIEVEADRQDYEKALKEYRQKYAVQLQVNDYYDALHSLSY